MDTEEKFIEIYDKSKPLKVYRKDNLCHCPVCHRFDSVYDAYWHPNNFCGHCGQTLDWTDTDANRNVKKCEDIYIGRVKEKIS